jgi:hypothetical protein
MTMRFIKDTNGVVRFEENPIVRRLLDESQARGFGLNELGAIDFPLIEWEEFYRLIGYSLAGYHELSNVTDESAIAATMWARKEFPEFSTGLKGCRDDGCEIHSGVNYR